jgi:S-formylglutathione hydrolase FrmB
MIRHLTTRSLRPGLRVRPSGPDAPAFARRLALVFTLGAAGAVRPAAAQPPATAPRADNAWVTRAVEAPRVAHRTFQSAAARTAVSYHLYTPAAYAREPQRRFPVVYWLHGSGGGLPGIPQLARRFDVAIEGGRLPPVLVVMVNGLEMGMYVDWRDGSAPVETVLARELVDHVDATYRTVASREGRLLDGFSMGGYGAARFGFKFPERFRAVSIMGAGPMQEELSATPRAGPAQARALLQRVYGGDQAYFRAVSPRRLAEEGATTLATGSLIRVVVGDADETYRNNVAFHEHLQRLGIPHQWRVLPGVPHNPNAVLEALGDDHWAFYRAAFAPPG